MVAKFIILGLLGLSFGSFVNVLVWRIRQQELAQAEGSKLKAKSRKYSVLSGRSQCIWCGHQLAALDMVPVLSWLKLGGRCRYCSRPITWQYPLVEIAGALIFGLSYHFWPGGVGGFGEWLLLVSWLITSVGLLALLVYDSRWLLLPNKILYPTLLVATTGRTLYIGGFAAQPWRALGAWALSVAVASGCFWLLFEVSKGKWIGYGDVRLGLVTGTVLADPFQAGLMILLASVLGAILALPLLVTGRKKLTAKLAFGPFLIASTFICLLFGSSIIDWYRRLLT